jgi:putative FmdB family regulatory protein
MLFKMKLFQKNYQRYGEVQANMPVYEYECKKCKEKFEKNLKINENMQVLCPKCKSEDCNRLISKSSFVLKFNKN